MALKTRYLIVRRYGRPPQILRDCYDPEVPEAISFRDFLGDIRNHADVKSVSVVIEESLYGYNT